MTVAIDYLAGTLRRTRIGAADPSLEAYVVLTDCN